MTNEDVQKLAEKLITLDPIKDSALALAIRNEIIAYIFGFVKHKEFILFDRKSQTQISEDFYFVPLVRKCIKADTFFKTLTELLTWNDKREEWGYKPNRITPNGENVWVSFITALRFLFSKRGLLESELRQLQDSGISNSLDEIQGRFSNTEDTEDDYNDSEFIYAPIVEKGETEGHYKGVFPSDRVSEFDCFLRVAPFVALRKAQEKHLSKYKRSYVEGFYTFDTAKQTKEGLFKKSEVIAESELLFPIMELAVLEYLLFGTFTHMSDIANNAIIDEKRLGQRNKTMQVCYDITGPTVTKKNKLYRRLWNSVNAYSTTTG